MNLDELKDSTEVVLARNYFSITYFIWRMSHDWSDGRIEGDFSKNLTSMENVAHGIMDLVIEKIILPKLSNKLKYNAMRSFNNWASGWSNYFYGMSDEDSTKLQKLETNFKGNGSCPEFENIKLPKEYELGLVDLTSDEWKKQTQPNGTPYSESWGENIQL